MKYLLLPLTAFTILFFSIQKMEVFPKSGQTSDTTLEETIALQNILMDPIVSLGCPANPAKDTVIRVKEDEISISDNTEVIVDLDFPAGVFDDIPLTETDTVCLIVTCEIGVNNVAFQDFIVKIVESPIYNPNNIQFSSSAMPRMVGDTFTKTLTKDEADPTGNWKISILYDQGDFSGTEGIFSVEVALKRSIPATPSDCDLVICNDTKVTLDAENPGSTYAWSTGENTQTIEVVEDGNYSVTVTTDGETATDDINITFNSIVVDNPQTICQGDSYTVPGGSTYNMAGEYEDVFARVGNGCDSLVKTIITVAQPVTTNLTESICEGDSYTISSTPYTTTGTYSETLTKSSDGCDSIVNLNLTVVAPVTFDQTVAICPAGSITVGSSTYTSAGTYQDIITSSTTNCDSIINTTVVIESTRTEEQTVNICEGDSHIVGDSIYTTTGVKTNLFTTSDGCDSILTTNLFVNPKYNITNNVGICEGQSITVGSNTYSVSGTYTDALQTASGCDSTITTVLTVNTIIQVTDNVSICKGTSHQVGSNTYTETGTYEDTFSSTAGCDSIVTTVLVVEETINTSSSIDICYGGFFMGDPYFTTTDVVEEFPRADDCDSIHTTTVNVAPELTVNVAAFGANCVSSGLQASAAGGSGTYTYLWSDGSTNPERPNLPNGTYSVTVSDPLGCSVTGSGEIGVFFGIDVSYDITHVLCNGETSGAIDLTINGTPPYQVQWSNGAVVEDLFGIPSGTYTLFVEDAIGCVFGTSIEIQEPAPLSLNIDVEPSTSGNNGSALAVVSGGTPPYSFLWTTGETSPIIEDLRVGTYQVIVMDASGCQIDLSVEVNSTTAAYQLNELSGVKIYPNPTRGNLSMELEFESSKEVRFEVFNISGQLIKRSEIMQGQQILWQTDLSEQATGTYFVAVRSEGKVHVEKIILMQQ